MPDLPPALTVEQSELLRLGRQQFASGHYFECHETLEDLWHELRGPWRELVQALIQSAVGCYHLQNDNGRGALSVFERALARLARAEAAAAFLSAPWAGELARCCAALRAGVNPRELATPPADLWTWGAS